MRSSARLKLD